MNIRPSSGRATWPEACRKASFLGRASSALRSRRGTPTMTTRMRKAAVTKTTTTSRRLFESQTKIDRRLRRYSIKPAPPRARSAVQRTRRYAGHAGAPYANRDDSHCCKSAERCRRCVGAARTTRRTDGRRADWSYSDLQAHRGWLPALRLERSISGTPLTMSSPRATCASLLMEAPPGAQRLQ